MKIQTKINLILLTACLVLVTSSCAQNITGVKLISDVQVTTEGLYFQGEKGDLYRHCNVTMAENKIFLYAMKEGKGEKQPITLLTYDVRFK